MRGTHCHSVSGRNGKVLLPVEEAAAVPPYTGMGVAVLLLTATSAALSACLVNMALRPCSHAWHMYTHSATKTDSHWPLGSACQLLQRVVNDACVTIFTLGLQRGSILQHWKGAPAAARAAPADFEEAVHVESDHTSLVAETEPGQSNLTVCKDFACAVRGSRASPPVCCP